MVITLVLCCIIPATAQSFDVQFQEQLLSVRLKKISEKSGGATILSDQKTIGDTRVAALTATNLTVEKALERSLASTSFTWEKTAVNSYAVIKKTVDKPKPSGKGSLSGTVLDEKGVPIPGASVIVPGTTIGTTTDLDGKYLLSHIPSGSTTIQISFMSYETLQVKDVNIAPEKVTPPLDVVLKESTQHLSEVVVMATYSQASANGLYAKQKNMVAMSDGVSADMIKKTSDNNVAQVLKRVSGVTIDNGKYVMVRAGRKIQ